MKRLLVLVVAPCVFHVARGNELDCGLGTDTEPLWKELQTEDISRLQGFEIQNFLHGFMSKVPNGDATVCPYGWLYIQTAFNLAKALLSPDPDSKATVPFDLDGQGGGLVRPTFPFMTIAKSSWGSVFYGVLRRFAEQIRSKEVADYCRSRVRFISVGVGGLWTKQAFESDNVYLPVSTLFCSARFLFSMQFFKSSKVTDWQKLEVLQVRRKCQTSLFVCRKS